MWALVDQNADRETRAFHIIGTGNPITRDLGVFVSTVQDSERDLVWHVFVDEAT